MTPLLALCLLSAQTPKPAVDAAWSGSDHAIQLGKDKLSYHATAGLMPMTDNNGDVKANIYFTAYTANPSPSRPVTFVWNGGPGGSSVLLHMYCMGPRMLSADPKDPKDSKKFSIVDNTNTLLPDTDLVFIDPVGTGYSRTLTKDDRSFWGVDGDTKATVQFIDKYLDINGRKKSPVYIAGESYGTFRAAGVAKPVLAKGIDLKGLILLSNAIRYDTMIGHNDNDLPYMVFLPTLTATAAYYKKLKPEWNEHPERAIEASKAFASGDYLLALTKGDRLSKSDVHKIAQRMAELTALPVDYIEGKNLRVDPDNFRYKILHDKGVTLGKYSGTDPDSFNPDSQSAVNAFVAYLRDDLGFKSEDKYLALNLGANIVWNYGPALTGPPDQCDNLKAAMEGYPKLKLFVAQGLYDFTTPFYGEEYSYTHLGLSDAVKGNWEFHTYKGGHMMYLIPTEHDQLHAEVSKFIQTVAAASSR